MKKQLLCVGSVALLLAVGIVSCSSSDSNGGNTGGSAGKTGAAGAAGESATGAAGETSGVGGETTTTGGSPSSNAGSPGTGGAAGGETSAGGAGNEGGAGILPGDCNKLANIGTVVAGTADAGAIPTMTGGKIYDGTYVLVSDINYAGHSADKKTHKRTLLISGTTIQVVNSDDGGPEVHATMTVAPIGKELNDTMTCPAVAPQMNTFTATLTSSCRSRLGYRQS
jgi:hypothetical protein